MTNNSLVVIPFNLPWEWSTDYTNQTAYELAKRGNTVICYMWSEKYSIREYIRLKRELRVVNKIKRNLYVYYPILYIPFRRFEFVLKINEAVDILILKLFILIVTFQKRIKRKMVWVFDPRNYVFSQSFKNKWCLIYDCVDYFPGLGSTAEKNEIIVQEEKLVKEADFVFANSRVLKKYLGKYRSNIFLVPQGFRLGSFRKKRLTEVPNIRRNGRPLVGYVGAVNARLDYKLLYEIASHNPQWNIVIWGPKLEEYNFSNQQNVFYKKLISLDNVIRGKSEKRFIPSIIEQLDIGIIPYDMKDGFNKHCYPMKIFEYFYLGKPVVSTNILELNRFPEFVKIGNNFSQWNIILRNLLAQKWSKNMLLKQKKLAEVNSWEKKIDRILLHMVGKN